MSCSDCTVCTRTDNVPIHRVQNSGRPVSILNNHLARDNWQYRVFAPSGQAQSSTRSYRNVARHSGAKNSTRKR